MTGHASPAQRPPARAAARTAALACALAASLAAASPAHAWGRDGHRVIGAVADVLLQGTRAQAEVRALLADGDDRELHDLERAAVWADCVKGACGAPTEAMLAFAERHPRHAEYHYTDVPFQRARYTPQSPGARPDDVVQVLGHALEVLRRHARGLPPAAGERSPGEGGTPALLTPREALLLVAHLVGDLHQPLHVGNAYLDPQDRFVDPPDDAGIDGRRVRSTRGGNDLLVHGDRNLHAWWDTDAVRIAMRRAGSRSPRAHGQRLAASADLAAPAGLAASTNPAAPADARGRFAAGTPGPSGNAQAAGSPAAWADESLADARSAYAGLQPREPREQPDRRGRPRTAWLIELPHDYAQGAADLTDRRLRAAGVRLAQLLAALWP